MIGFSSVEEVESSLLELSGIIVMESWTGRGVGGKLLDYVIDFAHVKGYKEIIVKTEKENQRALNFYKGKGFIELKIFTENIECKNVLLVELRKTL